MHQKKLKKKIQKHRKELYSKPTPISVLTYSRMLLFGWIGGGLSVAYTAPQILHMWRTKTSAGVSAMAMWVRVVSLALYIVHGVLIMDPPLIVMSALAVTQSLIILFLEQRYRVQDSEGISTETT